MGIYEREKNSPGIFTSGFYSKKGGSKNSGEITDTCPK